MSIVLLAAVLVTSLGCALVMRGNKSLLDASSTNARLSWLLIVPPVFLIGFVVVGLRPEAAGGDTNAYLSTYQWIGSFGDARDVGRRFFGNSELMWWPLQSLVRPYLSGAQWLAANFIAAFLLALLAYRMAARAERINPAIFCLVFLTYYAVYSGNVMRQVAAIPIAAMSFIACQQRRPAAWVALGALAIGLHWSALIVIFAPLFRHQIFRRDWIYFVVPLAALALSYAGREVIEFASRAVGVEALSSKVDLYTSGARESHIVSIWQTANFWFCVVVVGAFFTVCRPSTSASVNVHTYLLLTVSIVLLAVSITDLSERYLPYALLMTPFAGAMIVRRLRVPPFVGNAMLLGFFVAMAFAVYFNPSAQVTLGYQL